MISDIKSDDVSWSHPTANMYGCQPCPKCKRKYRAAYTKPDNSRPFPARTKTIECDDCGYTEKVSKRTWNEI